MIYYFLLSSSLFTFRPKLVYNWTKVTNIGQNRPLKSAFHMAVNFTLFLIPSFNSKIASAFPLAFFLQFTGKHQLTQSSFNRAVAECRTKLTNILLIKASNFIFTCSAYHFQRRKLRLNDSHTFFKVFLSSKNAPQNIFYKWYSIFLTLMPAYLRISQRFII